MQIGKIMYWLIPLIILNIILIALALWKSARNNQIYWFISFLIFNTGGILPLIYLIFFRNEAEAIKNKAYKLNTGISNEESNDKTNNTT